MAECKYPDKYEVLSMIAKTTFRQFGERDWDTYQGCQSEEPMIGTYGDFTIIIDGNDTNVIHCEEESNGNLYSIDHIFHF